MTLGATLLHMAMWPRSKKGSATQAIFWTLTLAGLTTKWYVVSDCFECSCITEKFCRVMYYITLVVQKQKGFVYI